MVNKQFGAVFSRNLELELELDVSELCQLGVTIVVPGLNLSGYEPT